MAARVALEDVLHVAALARLALTEDRAVELTKELNTILAHMEVLGRIDTKGVAEATAGPEAMRLRPDRGPAIPLEESPESFVPVMREGLIKVPRLSTHEDTGSR